MNLEAQRRANEEIERIAPEERTLKIVKELCHERRKRELLFRAGVFASVSTLEEPKPGEYESVGSDPEESVRDLEPGCDSEEPEYNLRRNACRWREGGYRHHISPWDSSSKFRRKMDTAIEGRPQVRNKDRGYRSPLKSHQCHPRSPFQSRRQLHYPRIGDVFAEGGNHCRHIRLGECFPRQGRVCFDLSS